MPRTTPGSNYHCQFVSTPSLGEALQQYKAKHGLSSIEQAVCHRFGVTPRNVSTNGWQTGKGIGARGNTAATRYTRNASTGTRRSSRAIGANAISGGKGA